MLKHIYLCIYACDYAPKGRLKCGPETIARMEAALAYMLKHPYFQFTILLSAGTRPGQKHTAVSLKVAMEDYLRKRIKELLLDAKNNIRWPDFFIAKENYWGTFNETRGMIELMEDDDHSIVVVTSKYHIPRVKFAWWLLWHRKPIFVPVKKTAHWLSPIMELPKFAKMAWQYNELQKVS